MVALLGLLSLFGFIVCTIIAFIMIIRKKSVKRMVISILICFIVFIICFIVSIFNEKNESVENNTMTNVTSTYDVMPEKSEESELDIEMGSEDMSEIKSSTKESTKEINYDELQKVFLAITTDTKEEDVKKLIDEYDLKYTVNEYAGTSPKELNYKLAYDMDVAYQDHAKTGDNVEITFNEDDGSLLYTEYFNKNSWMTAIFYSYGIYWDFCEEEKSNAYTGYYYYKSGDSDGGIKITYSNGNSKETGYHSVSSAEDALLKVLE